jgi:hypothetical protein
MTHLWEIDTYWFGKRDDEVLHSTFPYKSWKDFMEYKPYKLWKPYILSSWSWKTFDLNEKPVRRRHPDKTTMDCRHMLRIHPSIYDKEDLDSEIAVEKVVEMLQIVFLSPDRFTGVHRVEIVIQKEDESLVKDWLKRHMPNFWKID